MKRSTVIYNSRSQSFSNYLKWSNEKSVVSNALKKVLGNNQNVLDIGAGNGILTQKLSTSFKKVVAVEPSRELFLKLKEKCAGKKFFLINKGFEDFNPNEKFDVILAAYVIRYLKNTNLQLKRIRDMLKEDGRFILIANEPERKFLNFYNRFKWKILKKRATPTYVNFSSILKENGFKFRKLKITSSLKIPNKHAAILMLDFFFDIENEKIDDETKLKIKDYLIEHFGNGPIRFNSIQHIFICSNAGNEILY